MLGNYKSEENKQKALSKLEIGRMVQIEKGKLKRKEYCENPKLCKECERAIEYNKRSNDFCSQSCGAVFSNRKRNSKYNSRFWKENGESKSAITRRKILEKYGLDTVPFLCINCGIKNAKVVFCSTECAKEYKRKYREIIIENNGMVSKDSLREYLMKKYDSKCSVCGWGMENPTSNTVCLDMHHIDGDYKNSRLSNVELLCPNCHSLTNNYKRVDSKRRSSRIR